MQLTSLTNENVQKARQAQQAAEEARARLQRHTATLAVPLTNTLYYNTANCGKGRMQLGGTCWFHAILNVFLLSPLGHRLLRGALSQYLLTQPNLLNIRNNSNSCPMRGKINLQYFWSYVRYKLSNSNSGKTSRNNLVSENHLIRNLKLRGQNQNTAGGGAVDMARFLDAVFPKNIQRNILHQPYTSENSTRIPTEMFGYQLIGCYIAATWKVSHVAEPYVRGHAICGYICSDGTPYIYDSNMTRSIKLDWINDPASLEEFFKRRYMYEDWRISNNKPSFFARFPIYVNGSVSNNNLARPPAPKPRPKGRGGSLRRA